MMVRATYVLLAALAVTTAACAEVNLEVVTRAPGGRYAGLRQLAVQPVDFSGLRVGNMPEPAYLARKDMQQQASFQADKEGLSAAFSEMLRSTVTEAHVDVLMTAPGDAPIVIRPTVMFIEPGAFMGITERPSKVEMRVQIVATNGALLEDVKLTHGTDAAGWENVASGARLRKDGQALGEMLGRYLVKRIQTDAAPPVRPKSPAPSVPPAPPPPVQAVPTPPPPSPRHRVPGGCTMDNECKGDRICNDGRCVAPMPSAR